MAAKKTVEIFYDVISPYSWLGFEQICRYQHHWPDVTVRLRPVLLGFIMKASDNKPPGLNPVKGTYMVQDVDRLSRYYQVPVKQPSDFMGTIVQKGSLFAQRLLTAVSLTAPDKLEATSRAMWQRVWSEDIDITSPPSLVEACLAAGFSSSEAESLVSKLRDQEVKDELKRNTDAAIEHGAFGAPTFVVQDTDGNKHVVFGSDRLHIIAHLLGEKFDGPLNELAKTKL